MTTLTPDLGAAIAGLCALIDAGHDSVLPILADLLADVDDPRMDCERSRCTRNPG